MQYLSQLYNKNNSSFGFNNFNAFNDSKNKKLIFFSLFILLFSVIRGLVPLITKQGSLALPTYHFSYLLGFVLSTYGFYKAFFSSKQIMKKEIRYLLILNLILTLYWLLPLIIYIPSTNLFIELAYKCWFPFAIYAFLKVPEQKLIFVFKIITLVVSGFVFYDFLSLNTMLIPNGYDLTIARYKLLRPEFYGISRTGLFFRPNGILGAGLLPHDSANLLAIFSVYWFALSFRKDQSASFLTVFSIITLLVSQSASNIIAGIVGMFMVLFVYKRSIFSVKNIIKLLVIVLPIFSWIYSKYKEGISTLFVWYDKISSTEGDWAGMTDYGQSSVFSNLFSFLFGYGHTLGISEVTSQAEQAFIKTIFEFGIFNAIIYFLLLSMPVIIYMFNKIHLNKFEVYPYVIAIFVGFLSLWHYGSVLRTTNIFVFFAIYGQFIRMHTKAKLNNTYV